MKKQDIIKILEAEFFYQKEEYDKYKAQNDNMCNYYYGGMTAVAAIYLNLNKSSITTLFQVKAKLEKAYQEHLQDKEVKKDE